MATIQAERGNGIVSLDSETKELTKTDQDGNVLSSRVLNDNEFDAFMRAHERRVAVAQEAEQAEANALVVSDQLRSHIANLNSIIGSSGTLTTAQLSNAVRVLAQGQKRLIKLAVEDLGSVD